jgi:hypothetical protein
MVINAILSLVVFWHFLCVRLRCFIFFTLSNQQPALLYIIGRTLRAKIVKNVGSSILFTNLVLVNIASVLLLGNATTLI